MTLSQPLSLPNHVRLPNRIAKAAMSEGLADRRTGAPTERLIQLYRRWASGGAALLITGNVQVDLDAREAPGNVVVEDDRDLHLLRAWADAAQSHGSALWMQINHAGRQTPRRINPSPVGPSAIALQGVGGLAGKPRELGNDDIVAIVERFATTAAIAQRAGFAGVQIHAAHGYLISQFLSPLSNQRTDRWGGDAGGRMRLLLEIVRAIRRAVGHDFPIGVKLNSADFQRGGFSEQDSMDVIRALEAAGIDLLEISGGNYESPAMMGTAKVAGEQPSSTARREAYFLAYAEKVRAITRLPLLLTGGMRSGAAMTQALESGAIDMVGLARPMAVEPDLPLRLLSDATAAAAPIEVRVGIKLLDSMLQGAWYKRQLHRMADGHEPNPRASRWGALISAFASDYAFNPFRRRARPRRQLPTITPQITA